VAQQCNTALVGVRNRYVAEQQRQLRPTHRGVVGSSQVGQAPILLESVVGTKGGSITKPIYTLKSKVGFNVVQCTDWQNMGIHWISWTIVRFPIIATFTSSVDGTFIWMKSFHIPVCEGTGDRVRRSVSGHPPRRGIFLGEICGMRSWGGAPNAPPKLRRTSRFALQRDRGSYSPSPSLQRREIPGPTMPSPAERATTMTTRRRAPNRSRTEEWRVTPTIKPGFIRQNRDLRH
jgi:hypothetical protein